MLSGTADRVERYPQFSAGLRRHADVSERQAQELEQCLNRLGGGTSVIKQLTGTVTAIGQTLSGLVTGDEIIKAALAVSTYAQLDITYSRILIAPANATESHTVSAKS